ncbi:hypothetical protein NMG60_11005714 [Bertholletia excelsa]
MFSKTMCFRAFLLLLLSSNAAAMGTVITSLPGFNGSLPFYLETGYVGVGQDEDVQLFYYFVESQRNPLQDPFLLWLNGGPGCSGLCVLLFESGPLYFQFEGYEGGLPNLLLNDYAWTQNLNILYVDAPVGTGFSYSETQGGYYVDDYKSAKQIYEFLRRWLGVHTKFLENNLYVGGESYSGIIVPMVAQEIVYGNEIGRKPALNLKGYILGNPLTDSFIDDNSKVAFAHQLTLIPDELYNSVKQSCNGDYVNVDPSNVLCREDIDYINELLEDINLVNILEPYCGYASPHPQNFYRRRLLKEKLKPSLISSINPAYYCRDYLNVLAEVWANNETVQQALNVRMGTKGVWQGCNSSLAYEQVVTSSVAYHKNLTAASLRALVYSGDHDMSVPHLGTQAWIRALNLTLSNVWRAWFVDGQVAGYTRRFTKNNYALTYATVKGAGHSAPGYKPKQCYAMIDRFFAYYPL